MHVGHACGERTLDAALPRRRGSGATTSRVRKRDGRVPRQACCTVSHTSSGSSGRWSFPPPSRGAGGRPGCRTGVSSRCERATGLCLCCISLFAAVLVSNPHAYSRGSQLGFLFVSGWHQARSFRLTEGGLRPCSCSNCTCIITYSVRVECVLGRGWRGLMRGSRRLSSIDVPLPASPPPPLFVVGEPCRGGKSDVGSPPHSATVGLQ
jgi:hypothetical protein